VAHWVTPVGPPRRFDTRFFVALAPEGQTATHDAGETVADQWVRPKMHWTPTPGRARHDLPNDSKPRSNCGYSSSRDVLDYARSLTNIPRIEPRIVMKDGEMTILMLATTVTRTNPQRPFRWRRAFVRSSQRLRPWGDVAQDASRQLVEHPVGWFVQDGGLSMVAALAMAALSSISASRGTLSSSLNDVRHLRRRRCAAPRTNT